MGMKNREAEIRNGLRALLRRRI